VRVELHARGIHVPVCFVLRRQAHMVAHVLDGNTLGAGVTARDGQLEWTRTVRVGRVAGAIARSDRGIATARNVTELVLHDGSRKGRGADVFPVAIAIAASPA